MVSRPLTCLLAAASLGAAAPAHAQLRDVLLVEREGGVHLWLAFDRQPASAFIEAGALYVIGVDGEAARRITPASPAPFAALHLSPESDGGVRLTLDSAPMRTAEVRAGGVWLTLDAQGWTAPPAARAAAARPDAAPVRPFAPAPDNAATSTDAPAEPEPLQTSQPAPVSTPAQRAAALNPACAGVAQELEDAPWDLDLIAAQGACLAQAGDGADATVQFERVLAFEPEHARAALGLARLKEAAGDLTGAAELYDIAARGARTDGEALEAMAAARRLREAPGG
ncbi:hypothetical protein L2D01_10245 [Hyphomonadaceae bacterium ML37]|nr:hypothetical protein L2D01_10245 [Hyphomonadaceae bacterium ML37]